MPLRRMASRCSGRRVADVPLEVPARIERSHPPHVAIARHLGHHRSGGDRRAPRPIDHRGVLELAGGQPESVDEAGCVLLGDRVHAVGERRDIRDVEAEAVDRPDRANRHRYAGRGPDHARIELLALIGRLLLGVVEPARARRSERPIRSRSIRTPAASSGPASEPRPASSTPATKRRPKERSKRNRRAAVRRLRRPVRELEEPDPGRGPVGGEGLADDPVSGMGPQKRLSSLDPRLSPIMK